MARNFSKLLKLARVVSKFFLLCYLPLCLLRNTDCCESAVPHFRGAVYWQVYKDTDLRGVGDLLAKSKLARGYAKSMYANLREQTLRPGRFHDQRAECLKAKASLLGNEQRQRLM